MINKKYFRFWLKLKIERLVHKIKSSFRQAVHTFNGGYTCEDCGAKYAIDGYTIDGRVNDNRMMFVNYSAGQTCPHCLYLDIKEYFETSKIEKDKYNSLHIGKCDFTGIKGKVTRIVFKDQSKHGLNIRFGSNYWNGSYAGLEAFRILLTETGEMKTSFHVKGSKYRDKNGVVSGPQNVKDIKCT